MVEQAHGAANGAKFSSLWAGGLAGYTSHSEADLALCNILAWWSHDARQMDRLFRRSGLWRPKWDERHGKGTYGEMTIAKALGGLGSTRQRKGSGELRCSPKPFNTEWGLGKDADMYADTVTDETAGGNGAVQGRVESFTVNEVEDAPAPEAASPAACPEALWRGPFLQVAEILNNKSLEVWAGTFAALSARAHKHIYCRYHRPFYGMSYTLLVMPTGGGKAPARIRAMR